MPKIYKSAQGKVVDMEKLRLASEETIAVGNMRVNARGDQLGRGGKIVKTRNQLMKEYYELDSQVSKPSLEADTNYRSKNDMYSSLMNKSQKSAEQVAQSIPEEQKTVKQKSKTKSSEEGQDGGIQ